MGAEGPQASSTPEATPQLAPSLSSFECLTIFTLSGTATFVTFVLPFFIAVPFSVLVVGGVVGVVSILAGIKTGCI